MCVCVCVCLAFNHQCEYLKGKQELTSFFLFYWRVQSAPLKAERFALFNIIKVLNIQQSDAETQTNNQCYHPDSQF